MNDITRQTASEAGIEKKIESLINFTLDKPKKIIKFIVLLWLASSLIERLVPEMLGLLQDVKLPKDENRCARKKKVLTTSSVLSD